MKFRTNIFSILTISNFIIIAIISTNCLTENIIRLSQKNTICQTAKAPGLGNPKVHKLTNDVYAVTGLYHSDGSVNAGIIFTENSVIFIDSGMTVASGEFLWNIAQKRMKGDEDLYLILTHHHSDHTFGMRVMKDKGAKIIAHKIVKEELKDDNGFYKNFIIKACGWDKKKSDKILGDVVIYVPDQCIEKDTTLNIDSEEIHLLATPGHVQDELSVYHPKSRTLFAGDTIYEEIPRGATKFGGLDEWKLWISQLERLQELDIETIVLGHGKLCSKKVIDQNISSLKVLLK